MIPIQVTSFLFKYDSPRFYGNKIEVKAILLLLLLLLLLLYYYYYYYYYNIPCIYEGTTKYTVNFDTDHKIII